MEQHNNNEKSDIRSRQLELADKLKQQRKINRQAFVKLSHSMDSFINTLDQLKGSLRKAENSEKSDAKSDFTPPSFPSSSPGSTPFS
jgi:hypothetical protein